MTKPATLGSRTIYNGRIFDIRVDDIRDGDIEYSREIIVHKGSAVIIPVFEDGTAALVRQYRHAAGEYLLEIPAGTLDAGEDPMVGAIRELEEEIGVRAARVRKLCEFYVSPGFLTEKMHLFIATGLTHVGQNLEDDEILTVERHPLPDLLQMISDGRIIDAKTMIAVQMAADQAGRDAAAGTP